MIVSGNRAQRDEVDEMETCDNICEQSTER